MHRYPDDTCTCTCDLGPTKTILIFSGTNQNLILSNHKKKFSPHLLSWAPKVEEHSFAGEVISSMKLDIRIIPSTVVHFPVMQAAQLHCSVQHPDPALQPAQRLAHGAAGAVSLPCNNRPGNEASIVIADLWRFRIHGFSRNCVGATTPADLRNNRPDCFIHLWLCKSTQMYPFCCTHTVWLTSTQIIYSHWLVRFQNI